VPLTVALSKVLLAKFAPEEEIRAGLLSVLTVPEKMQKVVAIKLHLMA